MVKEYFKELEVNMEMTENEAIQKLIDSHRRQREIVQTHTKLLAFLNKSFLGRNLLKRFNLNKS